MMPSSRACPCRRVQLSSPPVQASILPSRGAMAFLRAVGFEVQRQPHLTPAPTAAPGPSTASPTEQQQPSPPSPSPSATAEEQPPAPAATTSAAPAFEGQHGADGQPLALEAEAATQSDPGASPVGEPRAREVAAQEEGRGGRAAGEASQVADAPDEEARSELLADLEASGPEGMEQGPRAQLLTGGMAEIEPAEEPAALGQQQHIVQAGGAPSPAAEPEDAALIRVTEE